jgi:hypothetical protein
VQKDTSTSAKAVVPCLQVWAVDLVLFQALPHRYAVGEAWIAPASWLQLFGFSLLLAGTIIYAQANTYYRLRFHVSLWHITRNLWHSVSSPSRLQLQELGIWRKDMHHVHATTGHLDACGLQHAGRHSGS